MRQQNILLMKSLKSRLQNRKVPPCQEVEMMLNIILFTSYNPALEQVLGEDAQSSTMLQRFTRLSTVKCPKIHLSECQLDALRYPSGGQEATCGRCNSTEYPGSFPPNALWSLISQTACGKIQIVSDANRRRGLHMNSAPHPFNVHFFFFSVCIPVEGVKYEDRTCCEIGSNVPSEMCPNEIDTSSSNDISIGIIVGSSIASLCVICCCGWVFYKKCYKQETNTPEKVTLVSVPSVPAAMISSTNTLPVGSVVSLSHVILAWSTGGCVQRYQCGDASISSSDEPGLWRSKLNFVVLLIVSLYRCVTLVFVHLVPIHKAHQYIAYHSFSLFLALIVISPATTSLICCNSTSNTNGPLELHSTRQTLLRFWPSIDKHLSLHGAGWEETYHLLMV